MSEEELTLIEHQARHTHSTWAEQTVLALTAHIRELHTLLGGTASQDTPNTLHQEA